MNHPAQLSRRVTPRTLWLAGAALLALTIAAPAAHAQDMINSREGIALQNQIMELRHELQQVQSQRGGGGGSYVSAPAPSGGGGGNDMTAQLVARVGALEEQVRDLRGRIEDLQNQVQTQNAQLGKRIDDLSFQAQNPGAPGTAPAAPGGLAAAAPAAPPRRTPEMAMQEGSAALARRDYPAAEADAREVIKTYHTSPRAYDAQLLLSRALYGQHKYSQAAIAYDDTYNHAKKGPHAQDALLGLTDSLLAINQKSAACATLAQLHAGFPAPRADLRPGIASARQRGGCR